MSTDLGQTLLNWIDDRLASGNISPHTAENYQSTLASLIRHTGAVTVEGLTTEMVRSWVRAMAEPDPPRRDRPLDNNTRYIRISAISTFYTWAIRDELVDVNPVARVDRSRFRKGRPRPAPTGAIADVLAVAEPRVRLMILLAAEMGLRRAEIAGLRVSDFGFGDGILFVVGKGDRERVLPISSAVDDHARAWITANGLKGRAPLFRSRKGGGPLKPVTAGQLIVGAGQQAGHHLTAHRYRHRAGTDIARAGASGPPSDSSDTRRLPRSRYTPSSTSTSSGRRWKAAATAGVEPGGRQLCPDRGLPARSRFPGVARR